MQFAIIISGLMVLSGCGSSEWVTQSQKNIEGFQCTFEDVGRIRDAVAAKVNSNLSTSDYSAYTLAKKMNAKLASTCPQAVLKTCSPGFETDKTVNSVVGPINSLGVTATSDLKKYYTHDGLARSVDYRLVTETAIDATKLKAGLKCYLNAVR